MSFYHQPREENLRLCGRHVLPPLFFSTFCAKSFQNPLVLGKEIRILIICSQSISLYLSVVCGLLSFAGFPACRCSFSSRKVPSHSSHLMPVSMSEDSSLIREGRSPAAPPPSHKGVSVCSCWRGKAPTAPRPSLGIGVGAVASRPDNQKTVGGLPVP